MSAPARAVARRRGLPAFVDHIREFNRKAVRVVNEPAVRGTGAKSVSRQELADALDELERTVKALRVVAAQAPSTSGRTQAPEAGKSAAKRDGGDGARVPWALDTTAAMIERGQLVTPLEFQRLMGWATRQAVWKAADSHRVFYLDHKAERYFPTFYGDPTYDRKQLEAVTQILGELPGGSKLQFFLTRKGSLGGDTPLQALAAGRVAKVKDVAAAFAEAPAEA